MLPKTHAHLRLPPLHPALIPYRTALENIAKPAWLLRCHPTAEASPFQTHVGGLTPFVPVVDGWPVCKKCQRPLSFIWQVDFADFQGVGTYARQGLFQFFYCWECAPIPPDDKFGYVCRWYPNFSPQPAEYVALLPTPPQLVESEWKVGPFSVEVIPFLSVPGKFAVENPIPEAIQKQMVPREGRPLWAIYTATAGLHLEDERISRVGGYAPWIQYPAPPKCPVCKKPAEFVAAIGSDDTGLIWRDSGYWYFFACRATARCPGLAKPLMVTQCY